MHLVQYTLKKIFLLITRSFLLFSKRTTSINGFVMHYYKSKCINIFKVERLIGRLPCNIKYSWYFINYILQYYNKKEAFTKVRIKVKPNKYIYLNLRHNKSSLYR